MKTKISNRNINAPNPICNFGYFNDFLEQHFDLLLAFFCVIYAIYRHIFKKILWRNGALKDPISFAPNWSYGWA